MINAEYPPPPLTFLHPPAQSISSHVSTSDAPPAPHRAPAAFPLYSALINSPEYQKTIAQLPTSSRYGSQHYSSYKSDSTRRTETPRSKQPKSLVGTTPRLTTGAIPSIKSPLIDSVGVSRKRRGSATAKSQSADQLPLRNDARLSGDDWVAVSPVTPTSVVVDQQRLERESSMAFKQHLFTHEMFKFAPNPTSAPRPLPPLNRRAVSEGARLPKVQPEPIESQRPVEWSTARPLPRRRNVSGSSLDIFSLASPSHDNPIHLPPPPLTKRRSSPTPSSFSHAVGSLKRLLSSPSARRLATSSEVNSTKSGRRWSRDLRIRRTSSPDALSFTTSRGGATSRQSSFYTQTMRSTGSELYLDQADQPDQVYGRPLLDGRKTSSSALPVTPEENGERYASGRDQSTRRKDNWITTSVSTSKSIMDRPRPKKKSTRLAVSEGANSAIDSDYVVVSPISATYPPLETPVNVAGAPPLSPPPRKFLASPALGASFRSFTLPLPKSPSPIPTPRTRHYSIYDTAPPPREAVMSSRSLPEAISVAASQGYEESGWAHGSYRTYNAHWEEPIGTSRPRAASVMKGLPRFRQAFSNREVWRKWKGWVREKRKPSSNTL